VQQSKKVHGGTQGVAINIGRGGGGKERGTIQSGWANRRLPCCIPGSKYPPGVCGRVALRGARGRCQFELRVRQGRCNAPRGVQGSGVDAPANRSAAGVVYGGAHATTAKVHQEWVTHAMPRWCVWVLKCAVYSVGLEVCAKPIFCVMLRALMANLQLLCMQAAPQPTFMTCVDLVYLPMQCG
jgi:hypothetical protein